MRSASGARARRVPGTVSSKPARRDELERLTGSALARTGVGRCVSGAEVSSAHCVSHDERRGETDDGQKRKKNDQPGRGPRKLHRASEAKSLLDHHGGVVAVEVEDVELPEAVLRALSNGMRGVPVSCGAADGLLPP